LPHVFRDAFVVALLNPKTTLFFAAFLPQFIQPGGGAGLQAALLGAVFVLLAVLTDSLYVLGAAALAPRLPASGGARVWGRYASAATYIGLGLFTAALGARASR
jgi:threonine/homoserine/homoserine lactone efflux protein